MKKSLIIGAAAAAFLAVPALAADLPVKAPIYTAPAIVAPAAYNWTGFYVGGNVGYSWGAADNNVAVSQGLLLFAGGPPYATLGATDSNKVNGVIGGAQAGYNWQLAPSWLAGVEADIQASGQKGTTAYGANIFTPAGGGNNPATVTDTNKLNWFGTIRGRLGVTSDRWLVYATGGLAYGEVNVHGNAQPANTSGGFSNAPIVWSNSATKVGWTIGAGVENAISGNWRWKIEYLYMDLGRVAANASGGVGNPWNCYGAPGNGCYTTTYPAFGIITSKFTDSIVRVGINYNF